LLGMKAILLAGNHWGISMKGAFLNRDPNTILVLGKDFMAAATLYSMGPVLAIENAHPVVFGADLVWFVEKSWSWSQGARGEPLLFNRNVVPPLTPRDKHDGEFGDFGWRRPADFLRPPRLKNDGKMAPLAVADAEKKRRQLRERILAQKGTDVPTWGDAVVNPFKRLSSEGQTKLALRGIDPKRLRKLRAVAITGTYRGADNDDFVNRDPDTILILGEHFSTTGAVFSLGPVLAVGNASCERGVTGADLVWFVDSTCPRGQTRGLPMILAKTTNPSHLREPVEDVWFGDYGWDAPYDFLTLAPLTLSNEQMNALWEDLRGPDGHRTTRAMHQFVAGAAHCIPYLRQRLRLPQAPADDRVSRWIDDLDSDQYRTRQAASRELQRLGLLIEPELLLWLATNPTPEVRRRVELILEEVTSEKNRMRRAIQALGEMSPLEAHRLLQELAEGNPDCFLTREAKAVFKRKDQ